MAIARVPALECGNVVVPRGRLLRDAANASGREAEAAEFARRTIAISVRDGLDAIMVNSAVERHPLPVTADFHDGCQLMHRSSPGSRVSCCRDPALRLVKVAYAEICCVSMPRWPPAAGTWRSRTWWRC